MSKPRYRTTKWAGKPCYQCHHCAFSTLDRGQIVNHVKHKHPTDSELGGEVYDTLDMVPFASNAARALAESEGMEGPDFSGSTPTGATGGFTTSDVRHLAASRTQESDK